MQNIFKVLTIGLISLAATEATAFHMRLTETSITESGRVHSSPDVRLQTRGFGLTYILPSGLGLTYTSLKSQGDHEATEIELDHSYVDGTYTVGEEWLASFGFGVGVAGSLAVNDQSTKDFTATSYTLGVGYRFHQFEVYWLNRLNFPRFKLEGQSVAATLNHYQLGLGFRLD